MLDTYDLALRENLHSVPVDFSCHFDKLHLKHWALEPITFAIYGLSGETLKI